MNFNSFFKELRRRNVYKVAVAYAIVGWLLIQIATQVFPFLKISNWTVRLVIARAARVPAGRDRGRARIYLALRARGA